ncbi:SDR family oxidoreductase [Streptantibioticus silvisoli]|uniref:Sugar nucleotide-binding protein n=1 Tax=Streptantibioticus silvisoli TaxID=2705255 RepID=A0ABT6VVL4_9ACTN|nr:sugar nucleotide-binding protein [Streptantibioticus silvisoli]MDI5962185.1 sugar nucleotide-binding protein [Streptantibioticus silvisoli]
MIDPDRPTTPARSPGPPGGPGRVLVLGAGYLAGHIARRLAATGAAVTVSSRRPPATPETGGLRWRPVDVAAPAAVRELLGAERPDAVVAVHGPSDITWCEDHADAALAVHLGGARNLAAALDGRRVLLISTDNVFPGHADSCGESAPCAPANAYGRAKLAAEQALFATGAALALRVSLVYGWDDAGLRPNFLTTAARTLRRSEPLRVPDDHWNTPVLVDDVAAWTTALLGSPHTGTVHLGGPRRVSRVDWARHIARLTGADPGLVVPAPRDSTLYACRPRNACLHSERAARLPELRGLRPLDVLDATRTLLSANPTDPAPFTIDPADPADSTRPADSARKATT